MTLIIRTLKRVILTLAGGLVVLAGIVLLGMPGPGLVVVVLGIAILALEYPRAQTLLEKIKKQLRQPIDLKDIMRRK